MNTEEKLLLSVCRSYFGGSPLPADLDSVDWKSFCNLAKAHNTIGICHCVFNDNTELNIPENVRAHFKEKFLDCVYRYEMQSRDYNDISSALTAAGVHFVPFKGIVLRQLYTVPESRIMGDIDIIIDEADRKAAHKALRDANFDFYASDGCVYEYKRNGSVLELHTSLTANPDDEVFGNALSHASFNGCEGSFDDSFHFAYLIAHTAHHLKYTGAGIRFVLDLAFMLSRKNISEEYVFELLERAGLSSFARVLLTVCREWFGCGTKYVEETVRIQEYLIGDGAFGSLKDSERATVSRLMQCGAFDGANEKEKSSLSLKLRLAFPPYKTLRKATYIKFLDGHPLLLPVAWCYRLCRNLKHNRAHMTQTVKNIDDKKTSALAKEELEFFEEIGLYGK